MEVVAVERIGGSFEHTNAIFSDAGTRTDAASSPSVEPEETSVQEELCCASTPPTPSLSTGTVDDHGRMMAARAMQKSKIQVPEGKETGAQEISHLALNPLMNLPMPAASFFAHSISAVLGQNKLSDSFSGHSGKISAPAGSIHSRSSPVVKGRRKHLKERKPGIKGERKLPRGPVKSVAQDRQSRTGSAGAEDTLAILEKFRTLGSCFPGEGVEQALGELRTKVADAPSAAHAAFDMVLDHLQGAGNTGQPASPRNDALLIQYAKDEPWMRALLFPRLEGMRVLAAAALAGKSLDEAKGSALIRIYSTLTSLFPEIADKRFMVETLVPLFGGDYGNDRGERSLDTAKIVEACWKKDPGLVKPTIDAILDLKGGQNFDASMWRLIKQGIKEFGYEPGRRELAAITVRLAPTSDDAKTGRLGGDLAGSLSTLKVLKAKNPRLLEGITMPDGKGGHVSLEKGVMERILPDPTAAEQIEKDIVNSSNTRFSTIAPQLYPLISGSGEVKEMLGDTLEKEYAQTGSIEGLKGKGRSALAILASLGPDTLHMPQVKSLLSPLLLKPHPDELLDALACYGRRDESEKTIAALAARELTGEKALQAADRVIAMGFCSKTPDQALDPYLASLRSALKGQMADGGLVTGRDVFMSDVERGIRKTGHIGDMPDEDIRKLYLVLLLASDDESLYARLDPLIKGAGESTEPYVKTAHSNEAGAAMALYRRLRMEKNLELLRGGNLAPHRRIALQMENLQLKNNLDGAIGGRFVDATEDALLEGAARDFKSPEIGRFLSYFNGRDEAHQALTVIARTAQRVDELPSECGKLLAILDSLPDDKDRGISTVSSSFLNEDGDYVNASIECRDTRKMRKDLRSALSTYVEGRKEELLSRLQAARTRPVRNELMEMLDNCHTGVEFGTTTHEDREKKYDALCRGLASADPSTLTTDLPAHFKKPLQACDIYTMLAPDAEHEEDIGREWQRFKPLLNALGGEEHLRDATEAYEFARKKELEGHDWDAIMAHIYRNKSLGADYLEAPLRDGKEPATESVIVEEIDDEIVIGGLRLGKNSE
jgi:hypothetical protein